MRLTINDPNAVPALVTALQESECLAEPAGDGAVEVLFPWIQTARDAQQALLELVFFVRTWEAMHPGLQISLVSAVL